jgi:hypothetical protein
VTAEHDYLQALAGAVRSALGRALLGAYAGGSWALGGYLPGRSDLDVAVVVLDQLDDGQARALVAAVRHEALPCPARGLELVVYSREVAAAGRGDPGFELNLNTGRGMATRVERAATNAGEHWFAIDRAILAAHGIALAGPPAAEVFEPAPRSVLLGLLAELVAWHGAAPDDAVLNARRSLRFARDGRWSAKGDCAGTDPVVAQALAARRGEGEVPGDAAERYVAAAARELAAYSSSSYSDSRASSSPRGP